MYMLLSIMSKEFEVSYWIWEQALIVLRGHLVCLEVVSRTYKQR